jgi:biopolymer transport protein ExbD
MSEIAQGGGGHEKGGKVRAKKSSTRIDMTPMVDLGFLLITFFILATTLSKPKSMQVVVPAKPKLEDVLPPPLKASKVLTLFLGKDNTVWALDRIASDDEKAKADLKKLSYGPELRTQIFQSAAQVDTQWGKDEKGLSQFVCVIKPMANSTYKNVVDVLDEMPITKTKRYALVDVLTTPEKALLGDKANN